MTRLVALCTIILVCGFSPVASAGGSGAQEAGSPLTVERSVDVTFPAIDFSAATSDAAARADEILRAAAVELIARTAPFGNVTGGYAVHLNQGGIVSVTLQYSGYAPPMAHPMHFRTSVTLDVRTGTTLTLGDLFNDASYVEVLSEWARRSIEARGIPTLVDDVRVSPEQDFYLTRDALVIYYRLYEIAPYVFGFVEFEIPFAEIGHLLAPDGPVRRLLDTTASGVGPAR